MLLSNEEKHADDFQASFHKEERRKNTWLALFCLISRITDPEGFQEYLKLAGPTVKQYAARALVGGAVPENLEGDWHPRLFSIGGFESVEQALRWYHSKEYAPAKALRFKVAKIRASWYRASSHEQMGLMSNERKIVWRYRITNSWRTGIPILYSPSV